MATKLLLLLALAVGALALCAATTAPTSNTFNCPGGNAYDGNNRPRTLPGCNYGAVLCRTGDCSDGHPCLANCEDGTKVSLTKDSYGIITFKCNGFVVSPKNGFYKGCNAYCSMPAGTPAYVPRRNRGGVCGLSHADFCFKK